MSVMGEGEGFGWLGFCGATGARVLNLISRINVTYREELSCFLLEIKGGICYPL